MCVFLDIELIFPIHIFLIFFCFKYLFYWCWEQTRAKYLEFVIKFRRCNWKLFVLRTLLWLPCSLCARISAEVCARHPPAGCRFSQKRRKTLIEIPRQTKTQKFDLIFSSFRKTISGTCLFPLHLVQFEWNYYANYMKNQCSEDLPWSNKSHVNGV